MKQYKITGMSCAACSARVEKAVNKVPGVTSCSVSLLTNSMGVEGSAGEQEIIKAVTDAGYGASASAASQDNSGSAISPSYEDNLTDTQTPKLRKRLFISLGFLIVLMYVSMSHMFPVLPFSSFFEANPASCGIIQMFLAALIMVINQRFFISGFKGLMHAAPNMDTLVALGSGVSFIYSTVVLVIMSTDGLQRDLYFESAGMILTLITVGKTLESYSKGKTTSALKSLMKLAPQTAVIEKDGTTITVPVNEVHVGDIFVVRPGESIPVDGVIIEGDGAVDESSLTGESIPVSKEKGCTVTSATINLNGFLRCRAERVGADTTISQIIKMVGDAAATKAPIAKIADRVSGVFVPVVIIISVITLIVWLIIGKNLSFTLARAVCVLVISCPCSLGLATPVAVMVGNGMAARSGILFKNSAALEAAGKTNIIALDKTGTITNGKPVVTDIVPACGMDEETFASFAASLEKNSEHPLSGAVMKYAEEKGLSVLQTEDFRAFPGNGLEAVIKGTGSLRGGNSAFISEAAKIEDEYIQKADAFSNEGKTPLFFALSGKFIGMIAVADTIKEDSKEAIQQLKKMGIRVVMLTGDNERTARTIGTQAGVDEVIAGVLPGGKEEVIRALQQYGKVAMAGDGINDAPALTRADIGIAIGAGADIAIDAADIVLMKSSLLDVPAAIRLSSASLRHIHQNLFWAFFYNVLGIPVAAGILYSLGILLNPMIGAACMSLSSFCVVMNALRLNLFNIRSTKKDCRILKANKKNEIKRTKKKPDTSSADNNPIVTDNTGKNMINETKEKTMTKTMIIEGMMCTHCQSAVKKALESIDGVSQAEVSFENGTAYVTCEGVDDNTLKEAVEAKDYTVIEIK